MVPIHTTHQSSSSYPATSHKSLRTHTNNEANTTHRQEKEKTKQGRERRLSSRLRPTDADTNRTSCTTEREREKVALRRGQRQEGTEEFDVLASCAPFFLCLSFVAPSLVNRLWVCGLSRWSAAIVTGHWDELDPSRPPTALALVPRFASLSLSLPLP
ncbi:hypothetical protein Mapa_006470 [Marchantia paleacea]|nr:hypothetical protein Mapa_006470 [Marchantia paleacea]